MEFWKVLYTYFFYMQLGSDVNLKVAYMLKVLAPQSFLMAV